MSGRLFPVQTVDHKGGKIREAVYMTAYEVYAVVYGAQPAMIDLEGRNCRGGFSTSELIAFLYARSFPREEWYQRVEEALSDMSHV